MSTPFILPGSSPPLPVDPSVTAVQVLPGPAPGALLAGANTDIFADAFTDTFGVLAVQVLPPSSPY